VAPSELPIVLCPNGQMLRNPSEVELARCIGLVRPIDPSKVYDAAIIGAGPAGLAAAVYAASEGLSVIVLDCRAFGGQAGASARIENYMGFPPEFPVWRSWRARTTRRRSSAPRWRYPTKWCVCDAAPRAPTRGSSWGSPATSASTPAPS